MFERIVRDILESKEGRIRRFGGHWLLVPDETRDDGSYEIEGEPKSATYLERFQRISTDKQGRKMRLISKEAVHCPNPEYIDQFASLKENYICLSVPVSFCRKCPHYCNARKSRRRYATCQFKAAENPAKETIQELGSLMSEATNKAKEMME
jgi:hypothetical protein